ncbi:MAG: NAD(P)-dependent oxidoreductase [Woeseia sp.]
MSNNANELTGHTIGWIGTGRMGFAMAKALLKAGCDVSVYNRTRSKAEPLAEFGARIVDSPKELSDRDIVFSMVSAGKDLAEVTSGPNGLLSGKSRPRLLIDCSSISSEASAAVRAEAAKGGTDMLAAPVSGNAKVVEAGKLFIVASGPSAAYEIAKPYLQALGRGVTYVGPAELARMVKICHNLFLGVVTQSLAEIVVLAEKGGVTRHDFMDFINKSIMGSIFTKYKTPAFVNLEMKATFTPLLLRKDLDLGLSAGEELGVPLPLTRLTREYVQKSVDAGFEEMDFAALLLVQAQASNLDLEAENVPVDDGLSKE